MRNLCEKQIEKAQETSFSDKLLGEASMSFYPSDFEVKQFKEQQIQDNIRQAELDQLARELKPRGGWFARRLLSRAVRAFISADKRSEGAPARAHMTQAH